MSTLPQEPLDPGIRAHLLCQVPSKVSLCRAPRGQGEGERCPCALQSSDPATVPEPKWCCGTPHALITGNRPRVSSLGPCCPSLASDLSFCLCQAFLGPLFPAVPCCPGGETSFSLRVNLSHICAGLEGTMRLEGRSRFPRCTEPGWVPGTLRHSLNVCWTAE